MASRGERPDRCEPGGSATAKALAEAVGWDGGELHGMAEPEPEVAVVDESRCVGCFKCIEACPVDAIVGAHGLMHTVVADWCTGCALCVPVCPVDCIDVVDARGRGGDGQAVIGGVVGSEKALGAAMRLRSRHERKESRPPLRVGAETSDVEPRELARRAMARAKRRAGGRNA